MLNKVAVVTGSNKGIGFGIVQELCKRGVNTVYLTARDVTKGLEAIEKLKSEGLSPSFHQLDITDVDSIKIFAEYLKKTHGGIDILVNNAAITQENLFENEYDDCKRVIDVNYRSIFNIQKFLYPFLNENARIINISSNCGHIANLKNEYWIKELTKEDITVDKINDFIDWFLNSLKNRTLNEEDFVETPVLGYKISKIALSALTRVQQKEIDRGISINSVHPGFVITDMCRNVGYLTIEEASKTPVYLALDIDQSVRGKFFWYDKTEQDWANPDLDLYCDFNIVVDELKKANKL